MSNQTNELQNMMARFFQMNTASTSGLGSLPSNTVANSRGELKDITTRSGLVLDGPSVPMPPSFINSEEDERVEETLTDPKLAEYTIKVPPPLVQKAKPTSLKNYMVHQRDPRHPHIPYHSRMNQEKQQEKDEEEKIKDSKILIDELDPPGSSDFLPFPECDLVFYEDFSEVDALSFANKRKVFNPGILIHESHFEVTNCATIEKNVKKATNASLILEDFNPPLYELPFHKEVPGSETLLSFSSENEEKVFNPGILTSKGVHTSLLPELSHRDSKAFKVIKIFESPMEIFPCSYREDIRVLDVPCLHFYPP
ncbi:hypothetical protein Tco_1038372 [Tanacetum coccineum]